MNRTTWIMMIMCLCLLCLPISFGKSFAGNGFNFPELTTIGSGRGYAGEVAIAEDPGTVYFNPAGMTELPGTVLLIASCLVDGHADAKNTGSTTNSGLITGGNGGNPVDMAVVPSVYFAYPVSKELYLGLAVNTPYALTSEYDADWFGRYDSIKSSLIGYNISSTAAYALTDQISFGLGIDIQCAEIEYQSAIFTGAEDAHFEIEGDSTAIGFNAGVLVKPNDRLRIGLHYRSGIRHDFEGDYHIAFQGLMLDKGTGQSDIELPDMVSLGIAYQFSDRMTLLSQVNRIGWSCYDRIVIENKDSGALISDIPQHYNDIYTFSIGLQYRPLDMWTLRTGLRYEETPTVDKYRTTDVPDADTWVCALGMDYHVTGALVLSGAYIHHFYDTAVIDIARPGLMPGQSATVKGEIDTQLYGLHLGLTYYF